MEAKLYGQNKGGMSINGIIKNYYAYAGEKISAGDLVEYVNGVASRTDYGESVDTAININTRAGYTISAVALDENRVFIAHSYGSSNYLYGVVCMIDGATITYGTDTALKSGENAGYKISTCLLPNGNVFIAHSYGSDYHLYGMVVSIRGTTISSKGSDTAINSSELYTGHAISTCLLPNGNVFIAHKYSSSYWLYGIVVIIDGTTITKGSDIELVSAKYAGATISTCLLPNGNVFIAHSYGSSYCLYGMVVSISGTTITAGSDTAINSSTKNTGSYISTCLLPNGNVLIAHSFYTTYKLYGIVVSINNTSITYGTDTELGISGGEECPITTNLLPDGNVFITNAYSVDAISCVICKISDMAIEKTATPNLIEATKAGMSRSVLLLPNDIIFIAHSYASSYYLYAQIFGIDYDNNIPTNNIIATEYETQVRKITTGQFDGIAKTSGEGSPEYVEQEVEVTKTGNIFPTSGWTTNSTVVSSSNGYRLSCNSTNSATELRFVCDNSYASNGQFWQSNDNSNEHYLTMKCPNPIKITKMKTFVTSQDAALGKFKNGTIKGFNNGGTSKILYTFTTYQSGLEEITLSNADYYEYYTIEVTTIENREMRVYEWQTSEYVEKEIQQIPSTGHKDIVSIWTMLKYVTYTDNLFANKSWDEVSNIEYVADDGTRLSVNGYNDRVNSISNKPVYYAVDGDIATMFPTTDGSGWIKIELPYAVKITKIRLRASTTGSSPIKTITYQGSNDDNIWTDLGTTEGEFTTLTEIALNNVDFYKYYRIQFELPADDVYAQILEWQTSEYIVLE